MPAFQQVHEELGPRVRLIGINLDGAEQAQDFADEVGVTYELLRDPDGRATAGLGVALPDHGVRSGRRDGPRRRTRGAQRG